MTQAQDVAGQLADLVENQLVEDWRENMPTLQRRLSRAVNGIPRTSTSPGAAAREARLLRTYDFQVSKAVAAAGKEVDEIHGAYTALSNAQPPDREEHLSALRDGLLRFGTYANGLRERQLDSIGTACATIGAAQTTQVLNAVRSMEHYLRELEDVATQATQVVARLDGGSARAPGGAAQDQAVVPDAAVFDWIEEAAGRIWQRAENLRDHATDLMVHAGTLDTALDGRTGLQENGADLVVALNRVLNHHQTIATVIGTGRQQQDATTPTYALRHFAGDLATEAQGALTTLVSTVATGLASSPADQVATFLADDGVRDAAYAVAAKCRYLAQLGEDLIADVGDITGSPVTVQLHMVVDQSFAAVGL